MNSIIGFTDLMNSDEKEPPTERQAKRLEKIGRNGRQLLALINDILDLSKIEAERLTLDVAPVELQMVLEECIELARPLIGDKPVVFETRIPSSLNTWMGDEVRLRQIVTNLLSNAAKFTDRGKIILEVDGEDQGFSLTVSDTGVGIAPEHLSYVFDAFRQVDSSSTRRAGGTGLGLAICRKLCGLMGGEISAKSTLGEGSTFRFKLPWRLEQCEVNHTNPGDGETPETTRLMFLCSNDLGMVDLANAHLSKQGIEVRHIDASNWGTCTSRGESPHGILIDIMSPAAAATLRIAADISVPLIWLTRWADDHQIGCLFQLDGFILDLDNPDALARTMGGSPPDTQVVLVVAGCEKVRTQVCDALDGLGCQGVRVACNSPEAISELASGKVDTVIVHLGDRSADLFELIERARRVPEWSAVHIVGVVSSANDDNQIEMEGGPSEEFVRRHGILTPTLLIDIAEQIMAEPHVEAIGVTR